MESNTVLRTKINKYWRKTYRKPIKKTYMQDPPVCALSLVWREGLRVLCECVLQLDFESESSVFMRQGQRRCK